jgi:hypothetical protein
MAGRMPEAAGRGEGETADNGKLTWAVEREPSPAIASTRQVAAPAEVRTGNRVASSRLTEITITAPGACRRSP